MQRQPERIEPEVDTPRPKTEEETYAALSDGELDADIFGEYYSREGATA